MKSDAFEEIALILFWQKGKKENYTGDGYFCWYSTGETAANTPVDCMHKITNLYALDDLGGEAGKQLKK